VLNLSIILSKCHGIKPINAPFQTYWPMGTTSLWSTLCSCSFLSYHVHSPWGSLWSPYLASGLEILCTPPFMMRFLCKRDVGSSASSWTSSKTSYSLVSLLEINNLEIEFLEILLYFTIGLCVGGGKPKLTSTKLQLVTMACFYLEW
jgi:hypothetical protein